MITIGETTISTSWMVIIGFIIIWDVMLRIFALWKAAQNNHKNWFMALLIISSAGILPILYLLFDAVIEAPEGFP